MPNFRELTDEVINQLQGHSLTTPKFLTLGEDLTLDDSTLALSGDAGDRKSVV